MSDQDRSAAPAQPEEPPLAVLHLRPLADLDHIQSDILAAEARSAGLFLDLVRSTAAARDDESQLLAVISRFTFLAFPEATHLVLAVRPGDSEPLRILTARSRSGEEPPVALSTTLANRVMSDGVTLLYSQARSSDIERSRSLLLSRISNAICAPLRGASGTFGIIELDIRGPATGIFTGKDVDRMTVFAHYVALVLDNYRLNQEQHRAFESTINALVHSLSLKDPETASHSERVRQVAVRLGEEMGLSGTALEALSVAALLHDVGKQGVPDALLLKPASLSEGERQEMAHHASMTQNILDRIVYPPHLKDVPLLAAYHHEKMNGAGTYHLSGSEIPIQSRIISVADAFDALISKRSYKPAMSASRVLAILGRGSGRDWDPEVIQALERTLPRILVEVYGPLAADSASLTPPAAEQAA